MVIIVFVLVAGVLILSSFSFSGMDLRVLVVQSGSMEPAIKTGSIVFVFPDNTYSAGDIITFSRERSSHGVPITHRIIKENTVYGQTAYTVQGDANRYPDAEKVFESEVIGKVRAGIPYIGFLINKARTPFGLMLLVLLPAIIIVSDEFKKIKNYSYEK